VNTAFSNNKRVLVVSGEPRVLARLKQELGEYFDIGIAASSEAALSSLRAYETAAVAVCFGEGREDGFASLSGVLEFTGGSGIPVLVLASHVNDADEIAAFGMGASDYAEIRRGAALAARIKRRINDSARGVEAALAAPSKPPEAALAGKTILVVDDIEINRDIIAGMLEGIEGLTLDFAADGKEVVEKCQTGDVRYSLILMDVQMPVMDGLEAAEAIRRFEHSGASAGASAIPIIAVTAGDSKEEIARCLKAGMDGYIKKPMEYDDLVSVIAANIL
jgi:CheY-like chemotaxis protein